MDNKLTETGSSNRRVAAVPIWVKPYLTIEEAAEYTGIGRDKLYEMTSLADCPFVLWVGNRRMIKRSNCPFFHSSETTILIPKVDEFTILCK